MLLWIDRLNLKARYHEATGFSLPMYFGIGVIQCISMIPGVSRAGATIVGAMLFGADRRSAAEFSFWLAMPTMVGAFAYEVYKSRGELALGSNITVTAVGFVFSFIFGWIVVKTFLRYVQRHSFALFAWWRILVGGARPRRAVSCLRARPAACGTGRSCGSARDKTARLLQSVRGRCQVPAVSVPSDFAASDTILSLRNNST